jgi:hypothetical protein
VAIAASLLVAGGTFLADPAKVQSAAWRVALGAAILWTVVALLMAGARSLQVFSTIHVFQQPHPQGAARARRGESN